MDQTNQDNAPETTASKKSKKTDSDTIEFIENKKKGMKKRLKGKKN